MAAFSHYILKLKGATNYAYLSTLEMRPFFEMCIEGFPKHLTTKIFNERTL